MITFRDATDEDHRAWMGRDPPDIWCGWIGERDGIAIGFGKVEWDKWNRAWGWVDLRGPMPPLAGHRAARRVMAWLAREGTPALHAFCNPDNPRAEPWLRRLGFCLAPALDGDSAYPVWRCDLS